MAKENRSACGWSAQRSFQKHQPSSKYYKNRVVSEEFGRAFEGIFKKAHINGASARTKRAHENPLQRKQDYCTIRPRGLFFFFFHERSGINERGFLKESTSSDTGKRLDHCEGFSQNTFLFMEYGGGGGSEGAESKMHVIEILDPLFLLTYEQKAQARDRSWPQGNNCTNGKPEGVNKIINRETSHTNTTLV